MAWKHADMFDDREPMRIDCAACAMRATSACDDCVVTFLCDREPDEAIVIDVAEVRALRLLHASTLAPALRYRPSG